MPEQDRKYFFDANIFDAPVKEAVSDDAPPPPPSFSGEELSAARVLAFEQGRQKGNRDQIEARDQDVATTLAVIADGISHLLAAETLRENVFEKEALRLTLMTLDLLFPMLEQKFGPSEVEAAIAKTLAEHRKTKEISISVPFGMKPDIEQILNRLRAGETEEVFWKVTEDAALSHGSASLEWSDGGAVRDSAKAARAIRRNLEALLGEKIPHRLNDGPVGPPDVQSNDTAESAPHAEEKTS